MVCCGGDFVAVFVVGVLWVSDLCWVDFCYLYLVLLGLVACPSSSSSFWVGEFVGFCEYSNYGDVQQGFDDEEEQQLLELVGV